MSVCHGPAGLVGATLSNGAPLVEGKRVSATVETGQNWSEKSVVDGKLMTGQNPQSTPKWL
ncbi:hypothetical protein HMPREF1210_02033 [Paenisporosarcina sp. HGH0030]|nr:hypothetical protein HMPREF1210_02033 [Paenisporosarcina sp. HGH0030]